MFAKGDPCNVWRWIVLLVALVFSTCAMAEPDALLSENELLLELRLEGKKLGVDILGYQRGDDFLISLEELTAALNFPITVYPAQGSASGWFISEGREFTLDLSQAQAVVGGQQWPIIESEVVSFQDGIFVDTNTLQKWFPLRLSAVIRELYLDIEPLEPLPIQLRENRRERIIGSSSDFFEPKYPLQLTPYQFFSPHITRLTGRYTTVRQNPDNQAVYNFNYATLSRGDLGWMTSTLSLAGQSDDALTTARLKLERTAFTGPMRLNHIEIGDVGAGGAGILLRGGGRGEMRSRFDQDVVTLEGSQLPDWDVELYQNGQLISIQTTGDDGVYRFEDIPLDFGSNRFELKFFGPSGERESREEFHFLGQGMLQPGAVSYELAAVQNGRSTLGITDADRDTVKPGMIYSTGVNLGLTRNLTIGAGVTSRENEGEQLLGRNSSLGFSTRRFFSSLSYIDSPDGQDSVSSSFRTRIGRTGLNLAYTRFFDAPELSSATQEWQAELNASTAVLAVPVRLELSTQEQQYSTVMGAAIGVTKPFFGDGQLFSSLWYSTVENRLDDDILTTTQSGGESSFHTSAKPWSFRLSARYEFQPETDLVEFNADSSLQIERGLSIDLNVRQNLTSDTTHYGSGVNWQLDKVAINARVSYDSNERWSGLISFSTALSHRPGTLLPQLDSRASVDSGTVEVRVFDDVEEGAGERYAGVEVAGVQNWQRASTNDNGVAYLSRMPAHRQVDVELDESTLVDYTLRSKSPGVSIISRPGSYAVVEFPIVRTAELEGHVVISAGEPMPLGRALVSLTSSDGSLITQTRTAFDGFYLFEGIEPGIYQLSLEEPLSGRILSQPGSVTVRGESGVIRELDFVLGEAEEQLISLGSLVEAQQGEEPVDDIAIPPILSSAIPASGAEVEPLQVAPLQEEGTWYVQIGAYGSREIAQDSWARLQDSIELLQNRTPRFVDFRNLVRLLIGPGQRKEAADQLCQQLKARSVDCLVRSFE